MEDIQETDTQSVDQDLQKVTAEKFQFNISSLLFVTVVVAVAVSVVTAFGMGWIFVSMGCSLIVLNYCGWLRSIQSPESSAVIVLIAWVLFGISLALPAVSFLEDSTIADSGISGYGAMMINLQVPWEVLKEDQLRYTPIWQVVSSLVQSLLTDIANIMLFLLPVLAFRISKGKGAFGHGVVVATATSPWMYLAWLDAHGTGYVCWCVSLMLVVISKRIGREAFAWAVVILAAQLAISLTTVANLPVE